MSVQQTHGATAGRFAIDVRRFGWVRPLAGDYAFNFPSVAALYSGDPTDPDAWRAAIVRTQRYARHRDGIARVLDAQLSRRNAPPEARAAAARLANPETVAIVTGQQAGVFGGPLFTVLKSITALQLARRTAVEQHTDVVTIFWVDAEDHDWEEVASCTVLDSSFHPRTITLDAPPGAGELPVASLALDDRIERTIQELADALPKTEFTDWTMASLRAAYTPGGVMTEAFAKWLDALLGPYGLVVFESSDPAAKPFVADLFSRELLTPGRTASLANIAGKELTARGHQPQVHPQPDSVSLFRLDGARRAIRRQETSLVIGDRAYSLDALAHEAATAPWLFSPNVLLRPIVQDVLFPTVCYVAGPSELAYLGQLGGIYEHFGVPMPLMYPRASATLIDSAAARFLSRYDVPIEALQPQDESALNRLLESQLPESVDRAMKEAHDALRRSMERLVAAMPALDPTLSGAARTTLGKMEHDLRSLHNKMIQAAKRRHETLRRQFTRAQVQVFPLGQPQERTLAVVFFLNRYGLALVDRLLEELPLDLGKHWVLTI